tara:strand:- start:442 stop:1029 length:588 start_codon:yes stop_codon:yes gene_type:complete
MKYELVILCVLLISGYFLSNLGIKPVSNFTNNNELLPIITGTLLCDLVIAFIALCGVFTIKKTLITWYKKYRLSAIIADIFSIILGIILLRYILHLLNIKVKLFQFILLGLGLQVIHDILFYLFFTNVKRGRNHMLDFFKDYAKEYGVKAILGDSILVTSIIIVASLLNTRSFKFNIVSLFIGIYLIPYIIYMKD